MWVRDVGAGGGSCGGRQLYISATPRSLACVPTSTLQSLSRTGTAVLCVNWRSRVAGIRPACNREGLGLGPGAARGSDACPRAATSTAPELTPPTSSNDPRPGPQTALSAEFCTSIPTTLHAGVCSNVHAPCVHGARAMHAMGLYQVTPGCGRGARDRCSQALRPVLSHRRAAVPKYRPGGPSP